MGGRGVRSASSASSSQPSNVQTGHVSETFPKGGRKAENYVMRQLGVDRATARQYIDAVSGWSITDFAHIRSYQQGGIASDYYKAQEKALEEYISRAPRWGGGVTHRGIGGLSADVFSRLTTPGNKVDMLGTASWSTDISRASDFAHGSGAHPIVFTCKTQKRGTSIKHLSALPFENEVVVSKKASYMVKGARMDKKTGIMHVELEEV